VAIQFVIGDKINQMLAVGRKSVVSRAIRAVGPIPWVVYIDSAFDGFMFSVSVRSPNGRDPFDVMYVGPVLPSTDELDLCLNAEEYHVPNHPFF
jgi:hypothetical protein